MRNVRVGNLDLKIGFGKRAARMLLDFVNTLPGQDGLDRFKAKWEKYGLKWDGGLKDFVQAQSIVRDTWEGKHSGIEGFQAELSLGLRCSEEDEFTSPPIQVDWEGSSLSVAPRNLHDLVWFALIQHSQRLGVCESHIKGEGCPTPYFLKYRPMARFCSEACAGPAQRESKRRWWGEHGAEWLEQRKMNKPAGKRVHGK